MWEMQKKKKKKEKKRGLKCGEYKARGVKMWEVQNKTEM